MLYTGKGSVGIKESKNKCLCFNYKGLSLYASAQVAKTALCLSVVAWHTSCFLYLTGAESSVPRSLLTCICTAAPLYKLERERRKQARAVYMINIYKVKKSIQENEKI